MSKHVILCKASYTKPRPMC